MNKQELISKIEDERARLEEAISTLSPEQLTAPDAIGEWSIKDVLAHLAMWTSRCVTLVYQAEQGQKPEDVDAMFDSYEEVNAEDHQSQKDRLLDRVVADFRGSHRQLLRGLDAWKEADLFDAGRFTWLRGKSLGEFILGETAEHDSDHCRQIEQWRT